MSIAMMRDGIRVLTLAGGLLLCGCGREEAPPAPLPPTPPAAAPSRPETSAPAGTPIPSPAPEPAPPAPPPIDTSPRPPPKATSRDPEIGPVLAATADPAISTAGYTFRTMDHEKADVFINGHKYAPTPYLWSVTLNTVFDPKVPVEAWPPADAVYVGTAKRHTEDGVYVSTVELWVAGGKYDEAFPGYRRRYPHLVDGEHLFFVKAKFFSFTRQGALRVRVVGSDGALYRWVDYRPTSLTEDSDAERIFRRALWFERP